MNRAQLEPATADRLAKILGLLGSDHDGERAAAAAKADQLIRGLGLTWRDIVAPPIAPQTPRIRAWRSGETDWQRMARFCHARQGQLSLRDRDFVRTMLHWRGTPSANQESWLIDLYMQCGGSR
jgi:hypothetical protein